MRRAQVVIAVLGILTWAPLLGAGGPSLLCAAGIAGSAFALTEAVTRGSTWFRLPRAERERRIARFRAADAALQAYEAPGRDEDETYLDLNDRVNDLWHTVPWWRR